MRNGEGLLLRDRVKGPSASREVPRSDGEPGDESDAFLFAVLQHVVARPVGEVVSILHGRDRHYRASRDDFGDVHV